MNVMLDVTRIIGRAKRPQFDKSDKEVALGTLTNVEEVVIG